jgi:outer membrane protein OmpA-like peptidoglycan-associated protein
VARPVLGDLDLEQVQVIETDDDQVVTRHPVPGLDGDLLQQLGRRGARVRLAGVLTAADTLASLETLRQRFHAAEPVPFVSDLTTATLVDQVLIEAMDVRELAGRPARLEYAFTLREFTPGEPVETEPVDLPPPELPPVDHGSLSVRVVVEGEPAFDFDRAQLTVHGTQDADGAPFQRTLETRVRDDVWVEDPVPAGRYTVDALVDDTRTPTGQREVLTGSAQARVENGAVTTVTIVLRRGGRTATYLVVHFRFDSSFIEPCLRPVLRQCAELLASDPDRRLVAIGHTDLVGSDAYNQSLSERRGRAVYAYLTAGVDRAAAVAEWDELRRARPAGVLPSSRDTWGTREYQQILQDLGRYRGRIDRDLDLTHAAVRQYQRDRGLVDDGIVGDATWPLLIEDYLGQDALAVPASAFLPNADDAGCDQGPLRWLGCSVRDPVCNTRVAWRPNRRTELLFVREERLPCPVRAPDTLALVPAGAGGGDWCLGEGSASGPCCFVVAHGQPCPQDDPARWCRQPHERGTFVVRGRIVRPDGSAVPDQRYVLTAPDGEYMDGEVPRSGTSVRGGTPIAGRTAADGTFTYAAQKGPGIYSLEVDAPVVAHLQGAPLTDARGATVCARLDGDEDLRVVIVDRAVAGTVPTITAPDAIVLGRPHTTPARQPVVLGAAPAFTGQGTLTRSNDRVQVFDAPAGGAELTFDGVDNVVSAAQLAAGHTVFVAGARSSDAVGDVTLTLSLTVGGVLGLTATHRLTVVGLTLDVGLSRPAPGVEPPLLPEAEKGTSGRPLQVADPSLGHERALVIVRPPQPAGITLDLAVAPLSGRVALWRDELPSTGQVPLPTPLVVASATIPPAGLRFFADGTAPSAVARDSGLQLGLDGVEPDGDRCHATLVQLDASRTGAVAAPPITVARIGVWDAAYDGAGNVRDGATEATSFVGSDARRLHLRVRDAAVTGPELDVEWRTLLADGRTADDAPASLQLTLPEAAAGTRVFVSRGVMLVSDDTDGDQATQSGLAAPHPDAGLRGRGLSNHRLRRARLDGFVLATYRPRVGVSFALTLPVFPRAPVDERRRLPVRVVRYTRAADPTYVAATDDYIAGQFAAANDRWRQAGLQIDPTATSDRAIPVGALTGAGRYGGSANNAQEQAAMRDLLPVTPDGTLTVVFANMSGSNAYATVAERTPIPAPPGPALTLGDRYLVFIDTTLVVTGDTLAHELHHVLFNRFDDAVARQFFTFNTHPSSSFGLPLPDVRIRRRIQNQHAPDPDVDPPNDNILNWVRRRRTTRFPPQAGPGPAPDATTGNTLVGPFQEEST